MSERGRGVIYMCVCVLFACCITCSIWGDLSIYPHVSLITKSNAMTVALQISLYVYTIGSL